jgi:hypothetical protein
VTLSVDRSLWPNAPTFPVCACGHGRGMHNISPSTGRRTGCSESAGPKATPCGCKQFVEAPVSLSEKESA